MWPKGRKRTDIERLTTGMAGRHHSDETRRLMAEKAKVHGFQPGHLIGLGRKQSAETVAKKSASLKGRVPGMLGKRHSPETRRKISLATEGRPSPMKGRRLSEETRQKISRAKLGTHYCGVGRKHSSETIARMRESAKKRWAMTPAYRRSEIIAKSLKHRRHWRAGPNYVERTLATLLTSEFPGEWKYVGNGDFVLGGKCPDFVNVNGKKQLIEVYGRHWHTTSDIAPRRRHFKIYGYRTIFVWTEELKSPTRLLRKIRRAHGTRGWT